MKKCSSLVTNYISSAQQLHLANGHHIEWSKYRTFPPLQNVLLNSTVPGYLSKHNPNLATSQNPPLQLILQLKNSIQPTTFSFLIHLHNKTSINKQPSWLTGQQLRIRHPLTCSTASLCYGHQTWACLSN